MIDAVRLRFTKLGKVRFVGHRDVARIFERALRKTDVRIAYTEGFSPRPKIAFGLALSTGHESLAEYLDIALPEDRDVDVSTLPGRLSPALPPGLDVVAAERVQAGDASLQEAVTSCTWRIEVVAIDGPTADRLVASTLDAPELMLTRTRKGKEVTDDLRPAVLSLAVDGPTEGGMALLTELATQPRGVRPNELVQVIDGDIEAGRVLRIAQWTTRDGVRAEPLARERTPPLSDPTPNSTPSSEERPPSPSAEGTADGAPKKRRRGSRGGRNRNAAGRAARAAAGSTGADDARRPDDLPERIGEGRPSAEAAERALVRKPQIGDVRPSAPPPQERRPSDREGGESSGRPADPERKRRRRGGRGRGRSGGGGGGGGGRPVEHLIGDAVELDEETLEKRRGRERKGRAVGRYLMCVSVKPHATQIAVMEGRALIEHYVSKPQDDVSQIHGNIYVGRVQNVLPGMEAAFVDIGTPKNAVLYRGDVQYDPEDVEGGGSNAKIEQILRARQSIVCQVTKNPIGTKGARLTQEVSLPGRFVVLIPGSTTYGISKRLTDEERKRLRAILDRIKPAEHGLIVRTAAEGATREELERDVARLLAQWEQIDSLAKRSTAPTLLYREPDMAVRIIREEFNANYRGIVIDDPGLHAEVRDYVASITPELADRVELHDPAAEPLPLFEQHHVHEQLHKALDRKVWLPSGGSLIIERTEALTVIDVNTGKNVGKSSLEETVFRNNLEAAEEVARQLRLRDIGGIIVIDFIDMEIRKNRDEVVRVFRDALARDKTRTQVFEISELGLVEMTRKRIGEGLLESMSSTCPECEGRGIIIERALLDL